MLDDDVIRLVIAARIVTDVGYGDPEHAELFEAVEAFASRVPYEDEPEPDDEDILAAETYNPNSGRGYEGL